MNAPYTPPLSIGGSNKTQNLQNAPLKMAE